jgi:hypothetical protein
MRGDLSAMTLVKSFRGIRAFFGKGDSAATTMRHAKRIPYTPLGYQTLRYDVDKVLTALTRNELKAIGT